MVEEKKSRTIRILVTDAEFNKIMDYLGALRTVGRSTIAKTDATASVLLAAAEYPEISDKVREFIRQNFTA